MTFFSPSEALLIAAVLIVFVCTQSWAQQNPKRLIMKDGTYQATTQWEVTGDRVRYYSAERYGWDEIPRLVDWPATDKSTKTVKASAMQPSRKLPSADEADEREAPLVVPGLRLPNTGGVFLLDTFKNQTQLVELIQNGGDVNKHTSRNILRSVMNPVALSSTQTIELKGEHARVQSHVAQPVIFIDVETDSSEPSFEQADQAKTSLRVTVLSGWRIRKICAS